MGCVQILSWLVLREDGVSLGEVALSGAVRPRERLSKVQIQ